MLNVGLSNGVCNQYQIARIAVFVTEPAEIFTVFVCIHACTEICLVSKVSPVYIWIIINNSLELFYKSLSAK